jgi:hypothetical protein
VSQALTLFTTPVVYLFFDRLHGWIAGMIDKSKHAKASGIGSGEPAAVAGD